MSANSSTTGRRRPKQRITSANAIEATGTLAEMQREPNWNLVGSPINFELKGHPSTSTLSDSRVLCRLEPGGGELCICRSELEAGGFLGVAEVEFVADEDGMVPGFSVEGFEGG